MEMEVPPDESNLSAFVEAMFNHYTPVAYHCEEGCQDFSQGEKRTTLYSVDDHPTSMSFYQGHFKQNLDTNWLITKSSLLMIF